MELSTLKDYLDTYLSSSLFTDYAPNGIQVEGRAQVRRIATAVTANLETIERACMLDVDALIVHHGLFWNRDPYALEGTKRLKIARLLEKGVSLLSYHLPLDAHLEVGNNARAALDLGWEEVVPFDVGVKARCKPQPIEELIRSLEEYYEHSATRALGGPPLVEKVVLISGSGYKELKAVAKEGADCFITGNFDEPAWYIAHEEKIHFLALGHSATERVGPRALARHLEERWKIPTTFLDIPNPF